MNVDRFELERSANGHEYSKIGNVQSKTVSGGSNSYDFIDASPLSMYGEGQGVRYYRLKIIDKDGHFTYSPVRVINNSGSFIVSVHPNPVKDVLHVEIASEKKATLQVQIVAQNGKVWLTQQWNVSEGNTVKTINTSALPSGGYLLQVTTLNPPSGGSVAQVVVKFEKL